MSVNCNSIFLNNELIIVNLQGTIKSNEKIEIIWTGEYGQKIEINENCLEDYISFYNRYIKYVSSSVVNYNLIQFFGGSYYDTDSLNFSAT